MRYRTVIIGLLALTSLGAQAAKDAKTQVQKFSPFLGNWTINAHWSDGSPLIAHNTNAWTLHDSHLAGETWVGEGAEKYQRYQSYYSYDAKHGCLVSHSFAMDGGLSGYRVDTEDGKTFKFGFNPINHEPLPNVRQTITFNSPDEYQWIVELNADGTWTEIMNGVWKRDAERKAAAGTDAGGTKPAADVKATEGSRPGK